MKVIVEKTSLDKKYMTFDVSNLFHAFYMINDIFVYQYTSYSWLYITNLQK